MASQIIFTDSLAPVLAETIAASGADRCVIITDTNVARLLPDDIMPDTERITIAAGDTNKTIAAASDVWETMTRAGLSRHSLAVNIGGGMVTDLGGFAAATYKRGIRCVNVATTVLGAVDAAVGGKTGVNFAGLKNQIGVFSDPQAVIVCPAFFATLPPEEILSGYGEVLKHALLDGPDTLAEALRTDPVALAPEHLGAIVEKSMKVKIAVTAADPFEKGLRKALNLGHTAGHALEELALERRRPVPHGISVAHGLVTALVLSRMQCGLSSDVLQQVAAFVKEYYPRPRFSCDDYPELMRLMGSDKKNSAGTDTLNFTLLDAPGSPRVDCTVSRADAAAALDITRDLLGV